MNVRMHSSLMVQFADKPLASPCFPQQQCCVDSALCFGAYSWEHDFLPCFPPSSDLVQISCPGILCIVGKFGLTALTQDPAPIPNIHSSWVWQLTFVT